MWRIELETVEAKWGKFEKTCRHIYSLVDKILYRHQERYSLNLAKICPLWFFSTSWLFFYFRNASLISWTVSSTTTKNLGRTLFLVPSPIFIFTFQVVVNHPNHRALEPQSIFQNPFLLVHDMVKRPGDWIISSLKKYFIYNVEILGRRAVVYPWDVDENPQLNL